MDLLVFAHKKESSAFFSRFALKKVNQILYLQKNFLLMITGEGYRQAIQQMQQFFMQQDYRIDLIVNLGVAGALHPDLKKGQVYPVARVIREIDNRISDEMFSAKHTAGGIVCVSAESRVTDPSTAARLEKSAHIVDRELWGIAEYAVKSGIPWRSYKIISDYADGSETTEEIIAQAEKFSTKLLEAYLGIASRKS